MSHDSSVKLAIAVAQCDLIKTNNGKTLCDVWTHIVEVCNKFSKLSGFVSHMFVRVDAALAVVNILTL